MLKNWKGCLIETSPGMIKEKADSEVLRRRQAYREHLSGYQRRDYEIVDYKMYELPGTRLQFRGPAPNDFNSGDYFCCIGAAQTFGCFCSQPFPDLLATELGIPALNLGYGGAGPEFFERHDSLDRYINGGRFLILQVMSGRSQSNSIFEARGLEYLVRRSDGATLSAAEAYDELVRGVRMGGETEAHIRRLARGVLRRSKIPKLLGAPRLRRIVQETRTAWIDSYRRLLSRVEVPVVLFWFSKRQPEYSESYNDVYSLFGEFPHLVNLNMVTKVRQLCNFYVEAITSRGSPQPLVSRFTGQAATVDPALDRPDLKEAKPWQVNAYYPSPEMHLDAATALLASCQRILSRKS